jgi:hemoglobin
MDTEYIYVEGPPLYERIGGSDTLAQLLDKFYDAVYEHPQIAHLFKGDKAVIKHKQHLFLTQFLGGPQLYTEEFGHPRMKARHMPHPIGELEVNAWLACMSAAIGTLQIAEPLKDELFSRFPRTAFFMANK